jgi:ribonuclease-3
MTQGVVARPSEVLCARLGYTFNRPDLLETALTHRSHHRDHNERLEFLGDAALGLVFAEDLFRAYPQATEGELSRLRSSLVNRDTLARIARGFDLGQYLRLGTGESKNGGLDRDSNLANALEALIGAIYLDGGLERCRECVLAWYAGVRDSTATPDELKDPKTRLQEHLQARQRAVPVYRVTAIEGKAHAQTFEVQCLIDGLDLDLRGHGSRRRYAEQEAARKVLTVLENGE